VFVCLEQDSEDLHIVQLLPLLAHHLLLHYSPEWFTLPWWLTKVLLKKRSLNKSSYNVIISEVVIRWNITDNALVCLRSASLIVLQFLDILKPIYTDGYLIRYQFHWLHCVHLWNVVMIYRHRMPFLFACVLWCKCILLLMLTLAKNILNYVKYISYTSYNSFRTELYFIHNFTRY